MALSVRCALAGAAVVLGFAALLVSAPAAAAPRLRPPDRGGAVAALTPEFAWETLTRGETLPLTRPWFCPNAAQDVEKWKAARRQTTDEYRLPPALHANGTDPHWFCDKMKPDVSPWPAQAARYTKRDLAIGIFSGNTLALGRGEATLDTWLADVPNAVVHTPTAVPAAMTVGFAHRGMVPDYHPSPKQHESQHVQLYGLQDLYTRFPHAKWSTSRGATRT